jgi:hypothetical protein
VTTGAIVFQWSWSYGNWIYNYQCNQFLSPLTLWVRIPLRQGILDTTLCDKVCQWPAAGLWFSSVTLVSSSSKTDPHDITKIWLKPNPKKIVLFYDYSAVVKIHFFFLPFPFFFKRVKYNAKGSCIHIYWQIIKGRFFNKFDW